MFPKQTEIRDFKSVKLTFDENVFEFSKRIFKFML